MRAAPQSQKQTGNKQSTLESVKWFCLSLLALFLFGPFLISQPIFGLDRLGHWSLACITVTLVAWIVHPARLPRGVAGVLMMGLLLAGKLSYADVFYGFTTSAKIGRAHV